MSVRNSIQKHAVQAALQILLASTAAAVAGCPGPAAMSQMDAGNPGGPGPDSGTMEMTGSASCPQIGDCIANGGDPQTCENMGTAAAQTAWSDLFSCLDGICGASGANVCQDPTSQACNACGSAATSQGGPCMNAFVACQQTADAGSNPADAGPNPVDAGPNPTDAGHNPMDAGHNPMDAGPMRTSFTIGGTISGISGIGGTVVLQNIGSDGLASTNLSLSADGNFSFPMMVPNGTPYTVTVSTQPSSGYCFALENEGVVAGADVTGITITCGTVGSYSVGGSVTGLDTLGNNLEGGLIDIYLNGNTGLDTQSEFLDGTFTFFNTLQTGQPYNVTFDYGVTWNGGVCWVTDGSGIIGFSDVTNVQVTCGSGPVPQYTVGGTIMGLTGSVQLSLNGGAGVTETTNGAFHFSNQLNDGASYMVTVVSQPPGQVCDVLGGVGSVTDANVTDIIVACETQTEYTIGGQVSGLTGSLVLQDNGGDNLTVTQNGTFSFATPGPAGFAYDVTVLTYPTGQYCTITGGSGSVTSANITNVMVSCATATNVTISGTVTGLNFLKNEGGGGSITLLDNGGDAHPISADGAFTFATSVEEGRPYAVTVQTQPSMGTCSITNGSGDVATANITNVTVVCTSANGTYAVGGNASGITGPVVLDDEGDMITINSDGDYQFSELLPPGGVFNVTIVSAPAGQLCLLSATSGSNVQGDVEVDLSCATAENLGGTISGLSGSVVLANGTANLTVTSPASTFQFAGQFQEGTTYDVTVKTQPTGQICTIMDGSGTFTGPVSNVAVVCVPSFPITGAISGQTGSVVLQDNGGDNLTVAANATTFIFATAVGEGMPYAVTVKTAPTGQQCTVSNGSGTVSTFPPTGISIVCKTVYSVGGTLSWTPSNVGTVVLQNNGGDNLTLTSSQTGFTFATRVASGSQYHVTVLTQPTGETCTVTNGGPTTISANVTNVSISCVGYTIGGGVTGLGPSTGGPSPSLVLYESNGGPTTTITSNGSFTFPGLLAPGAGFNVSVKTNPYNETCTVTGGLGTATANVNTITVACSFVNTCIDEILDGTETATDCGGSCPACALGDTCKVAGDCSSSHCVAQTCCTPLNVAIFGNPGSGGSSSNFVQWLTNEGTNVTRIQTTSNVTVTASTLQPYDIVILDWLTRDYTAAEATVFSDWVSSGGAVMAMSGYDNNETDDWHANSLLAPLKVAYSGSLLNGPVTNFVNNPITQGLTSVIFAGGYGVSDLGGTQSTRTPVAYLPSGGGTVPAGIAVQYGSGRAFVWGDEWIEYDSQWSANPEIPQFWQQIFKWIAPTVKCELETPDGGM